MNKLLKTTAAVALARRGLRELRRIQRQRRSMRRNAMLTKVAVGIGVGAAVYVVARELWLRPAEAPQWPSRKKLERDAKVREARLKKQAEAQHAPPEVHLERGATTELKATLGDVAGNHRGH